MGNFDKNLTVLIVSSDPVLVLDLYKAGGNYFFAVEVVHSAEEALNIHEIGRFDIVYLNMKLPNMKGAELIKNIKNYDKNQQFIILIDETDEKQLFPMIQQGVSSFIVKPLGTAKFIRATNQVKYILEERRSHDYTKELHDKLDKVTNQNELQNNMLIQQSKLAQTGEMISMIAHQWRQPLSVITAIIATIRTRMDLDIYKREDDPYSLLEDELHSAFERIEESADFLSKTVNDFRNFYRPNTESKIFNVSTLIESVCRMALLDKDQLDIDLKVTKDDSIVLSTFENELKQVLINIINNAKDAFIENEVKKPRLRIALKQGGEFVYINITDNAGGIKPSIIEQIFLPYFSTKSEKNGTGIGLHMAKTIVEHHIGGTLDVTNNQAFGGADFCIKIPFRNEELPS